ncbi:MAG: PIN domain-containing protein [Actinomycetota bacterium]|nr:PIN domain-containing protein [Actinomycetota bacterium]
MSGFGDPALLDNSAWARVLLGRLPAAANTRWRQALRSGEIRACPPFVLEALYSARDGRAYVELAEELGALPQAPAHEATWRLAREAQGDLASSRAVSHRVKPIDVLVAAIAHHERLAVLHYDRDYDVLAEHSRLRFPSVWIAPAGSID